MNQVPATNHVIGFAAHVPANKLESLAACMIHFEVTSGLEVLQAKEHDCPSGRRQKWRRLASPIRNWSMLLSILNTCQAWKRSIYMYLWMRKAVMVLDIEMHEAVGLQLSSTVFDFVCIERVPSRSRGKVPPFTVIIGTLSNLQKSVLQCFAFSALKAITLHMNK